MFEDLVDYYKNDEKLYDFSKSISEYMVRYFNELHG